MPPAPAEDDSAIGPGLDWSAAGLLLASGVHLAAERRPTAQPPRRGPRWAPLLVAAPACAAHVARAVRRRPAARTMTRLLDGLVAGVGAAAVAVQAYRTLRTRRHGTSRPRRYGRSPNAHPTLAALTFGTAGLLGIALDRAQRRDAREHARLRRRASIVQRLVPGRRARVDRIVVHV